MAGVLLGGQRTTGKDIRTENGKHCQLIDSLPTLLVFYANYEMECWEGRHTTKRLQCHDFIDGKGLLMKARTSCIY